MVNVYIANTKKKHKPLNRLTKHTMQMNLTHILADINNEFTVHCSVHASLSRIYIKSYMQLTCTMVFIDAAAILTDEHRQIVIKILFGFSNYFVLSRINGGIMKCFAQTKTKSTCDETRRTFITSAASFRYSISFLKSATDLSRLVNTEHIATLLYY